MATRYDPAIISKLADKLYKQANSVVVVYTLLGIIIGGVAGFGVGARDNGPTFAGVGALLVGALGFAVGLSRSFMLRVQAQMALCQKQIEENTRRD